MRYCRLGCRQTYEALHSFENSSVFFRIVYWLLCPAAVTDFILFKILSCFLSNHVLATMSSGSCGLRHIVIEGQELLSINRSAVPPIIRLVHPSP